MGTQPAVSPHDSLRPDAAPSFREMTSVFGAIGLQSFGGPAAQIALMHRMLVEERRWLDERAFLSALSFCMLLPGPEAMQLATYSGWRLHGTKGGLAAGLLFVAPGAALVLALSIFYGAYGKTSLVAALFTGVKAAVLAIVLEALGPPWAPGVARLHRLARRRRCLRRHLLLQGAVSTRRHRRRSRRLFPRRCGNARGRRCPRSCPSAAVANAAHPCRVAGGMDRAARCRRRPVRERPRAGSARVVLLQARGCHLRWRLRGAGLHGAGRGRALRLAVSRRDARRPRPRRDHQRPAHPRHRVRRLHGRASLRR